MTELKTFQKKLDKLNVNQERVLPPKTTIFKINKKFYVCLKCAGTYFVNKRPTKCNYGDCKNKKFTRILTEEDLK